VSFVLFLFMEKGVGFICTLTSINNFTGKSAKQRTNVGFNQNSLFLHWEKSNPSLSITNNKGCTPLWPTQVRCFALSPVKLFMEVSVQYCYYPCWSFLLWPFCVCFGLGCFSKLGSLLLLLLLSINQVPEDCISTRLSCKGWLPPIGIFFCFLPPSEYVAGMKRCERCER
jgi:hypothetical protein